MTRWLSQTVANCLKLAQTVTNLCCKLTSSCRHIFFMHIICGWMDKKWGWKCTLKLIDKICIVDSWAVQKSGKNCPSDSLNVRVYYSLYAYLVQTDVLGNCILSHHVIYKSKKSLIGLPTGGRAMYWSFDIKSIAKFIIFIILLKNVNMHQIRCLLQSFLLPVFLVYQTIINVIDFRHI